MGHTMHKCSVCGLLKEYTGFAKDARNPSGYAGYCKACHNKRSRNYALNNPDKVKLAVKQWSINNPDRRQAISRKYNIGKHHITLEDFDNLRELQSYRCADCNVIEDVKPLEVDHDHSCCPGPYSCGKCIRNLVCHKCNMKRYWYEDFKDSTSL